MSPLPGAVLTSASEDFVWQANGANVSTWWLYAGTSEGGKQLFDSGALTGVTSINVPGLPDNGVDIYIRLWFLSANDSWNYRDWVYQASGSAGSIIVSPAAGDVLTGSSQLFTWQSSELAADEWWLYIGSTALNLDYFNSGNIGNVSLVNATNLPVDGTEVHATLWFRQSGGVWYSRQWVLTAGGG